MVKRSRRKSVGRRIEEVIRASERATKKPEGWRNKHIDDSWRHSMAARGMKTVYTKKHPREVWLPEELFAFGGKGRWIDDSMGSIPIHNILDLEHGIEIVEDSGRSVAASKLYDETSKYGLTGHVYQYSKAGGYDSSVSPSDSEKWTGEVVFSYKPLSTHVGPNIGYHVHPDYNVPGSPFNTEMEARAAVDFAAAKFLRGRTFTKAVEEDRSRIEGRQEAKWDEQTRRYEFQKALKGLPPVGK